MADNAYTLAINNALASAKGMLGKNEVPNHAEIQSYLRDGGQDLDPHKLAWCAAFVSASLQKAGLPVPTQVVKDSAFGPGAYAPNYLTYGSAVDPKNVQAGDILVANNGSHVGFAEGPIRQGANGPEVQLLAGNERDASGQYAPGSYTNPTTGATANRSQVGMVGERWVPLSQYSARRYEPTDQAAPATSSSALSPAPTQSTPGTTINSTAAQPPNTSAIIDTLSRNIAGIESGGWKNPYEALNPTTHAIGKYQVMPSNVPGWTQAALGQAMTPDEFRANPQAQEAVFRDQMQRNLQLYGPTDAASIWFTGKPYNVAGGAVKDAVGTTNANYVARATAGLDGGAPFTPSQAPGPIDPSIIARGGTSPPIPGTTINTTPAAPAVAAAPDANALPGFGTKSASDDFTKSATALDKAMHGDQSSGQDDAKPAAFNFLPARNVSPLLPMASQIYGNTLTSMAAPPQWSSAAPGQNPYANVGGQPIGGQFGTQLGSMQQLQQMMAMMGNPYGDAGYG